MKKRGFWRTLDVGFDEALEKLPQALSREGFGVITQIDVKETLGKKLGVEFRKYRILGACNPSFAHQVLQRDLAIGLLLPCNFVLYEGDDGKAVLGAIDPLDSLGAEGAAFVDIANVVKEKLERVVNTV
jgi:uncharacterized protein (DUF302 family)